jgi:hypothetical protein
MSWGISYRERPILVPRVYAVILIKPVQMNAIRDKGLGYDSRHKITLKCMALRYSMFMILLMRTM